LINAEKAESSDQGGMGFLSIVWLGWGLGQAINKSVPLYIFSQDIP
jgi:hypothetical protein